MGRAGSLVALGSQAERCCPGRQQQQEHRGTRISLPLLLSYHLPFLLVSLKIGGINIPLRASTRAAENHFNPCLGPFLILFMFVAVFESILLSQEVFKVFFPPISDRCLIFNTPRSMSVSWSTWLSLTSGQPAVTAGQACLTPCASLIKFLRCFSPSLCYHTGL